LKIGAPAVVFWLCVARLAHAGNDAQVVLAALEADMQPISAGQFQMGNPDANFGDADERPAHAVDVRAFRMARHAVTFAQYDEYTDATGRPRADDAGYGRGRHPVIHVSWDDAQAFIRWLNGNGAHYRLPSEAEWEYAARAGSSAHFPWGDALPDGHANGAGTGARGRHAHAAPVGSYGPNAWGLYDMIGNVEQWVADCYRESYAAAPADASVVDDTPCAQRVRRGGSWGHAPLFLRVDYRGSGPARLHSDALGFRLARDE
jgi:formylglycine-generating enzyme required for sulfatase activity